MANKCIHASTYAANFDLLRHTILLVQKEVLGHGYVHRIADKRYTVFSRGPYEEKDEQHRSSLLAEYTTAFRFVAFSAHCP